MKPWMVSPTPPPISLLPPLSHDWAGGCGGGAGGPQPGPGFQVLCVLVQQYTEKTTEQTYS